MCISSNGLDGLKEVMFLVLPPSWLLHGMGYQGTNITLDLFGFDKARFCSLDIVINPFCDRSYQKIVGKLVNIFDNISDMVDFQSTPPPSTRIMLPVI